MILQGPALDPTGSEHEAACRGPWPWESSTVPGLGDGWVMGPLGWRVQGTSGAASSPRDLTPLCSRPHQPAHLAQVSFVIPAFNSNFTLDLELNQ